VPPETLVRTLTGVVSRLREELVITLVTPRWPVRRSRRRWPGTPPGRRWAWAGCSTSPGMSAGTPGAGPAPPPP
jgi:hypothetical protein